MNTTTTLTTPSSSYVAGQSVAITATVTPASGAASPAGTVQFSVNGVAFGSPVTVSNLGTSAYTATGLPVGYLSITATYTPPTPSPFLGSTAAPLTVPILSAGQLNHNVWFNGAIRTLGSGFRHPYGVAVDGNDDVFVADTGNSAVKEIVAAGGYTTGNSLESGFNYPAGIAIDAGNNLFVTDAGNNALYELVTGNYGTVQDLSRGFNSPYGVAVDAQDNLFIADTGHGAVRFMSPCADCGGGYGNAVTVTTALQSPWRVAVDGGDNLFITDTVKGTVTRIAIATGGPAQPIGGSFFANPYGIAVGANGTVLVTDLGSNAVREISAVDGFTTVSTPATGLNVPIGVAVDPKGNLFMADTDNNAVQEISTAGGYFGTVSVGSTSPFTIAMVFFFHTPTTLGSTKVAAQQGGAASVDFIDAGGGTCTAGKNYSANTTCTVNVTFTPTQYGPLTGVVELLDGSGTVLAGGSVQGMGFLFACQVNPDQLTNFVTIRQGQPVSSGGAVSGSGLAPTGTVS